MYHFAFLRNYNHISRLSGGEGERRSCLGNRAEQSREATLPRKKKQGRIEFLVLVMRACTNADRDRAS